MPGAQEKIVSVGFQFEHLVIVQDVDFLIAVEELPESWVDIYIRKIVGIEYVESVVAVKEELSIAVAF
jgi:hypothetical protein